MRLLACGWRMKKFLLLIPFAALLYVFNLQQSPVIPGSAPATAGTQSGGPPDSAIEGRQSNVRVQGSGRVIKVLPDDIRGTRHQRFILRLASGQTLLIAHNIDLAPRLPTLAEGDVVEFNGIYEWNPKGGVVHWTHRDPSGRHMAGWLKYKGRLFQ